ncbi:carboxypeptidase-like regulatory domain-containing protein [Stenotrophomonas sp. GD03819]|nr:carboxypeptidase-like regulatory domain-containing protein [Stenotrophomonas sp. GD03819]MDH1791489.1 carboxypeptidase-like regulatory domain-containing protein [Stenotrophomonas sp. GD03819]HEL2981933.1 carboxypeptidase regulatory-like domain-containing protein [Stenotrophomonas maltophilia]HEL4163110.1 carboxypeptidase regulatory-like domain-containing protein [Stenotrophomonas maltophilia]
MKTIILTLALMLSAASAQAAHVLASDITGVVVDGQGKPIAGAVVRAYHHDTNRLIERRTNNKGRYHFNNLRPDGEYTVSHAATSYTGRVLLGQTHRQNFVGEPLRADSPSVLYSWIWRGPRSERQTITWLSNKEG